MNEFIGFLLYMIACLGVIFGGFLWRAVVFAMLCIIILGVAKAI